MSYSEKTQNHKLPQWRADDKPGRQDFNEAFASVDAALANKANVGALTRYDLAFSDPYINSSVSYYCKNSFSMVTMVLHFTVKAGSSIASGQPIVTLPIGFRPPNTIQAVGGLSGTFMDTVAYAIRNDGRVQLMAPLPATAVQWGMLAVTFAAQ